MPSAPFETPEVLSDEHIHLGSNAAKSSAQANETYVLRAKSERPLGNSGEVIGFAKKSEGYNKDVDKVRQDQKNEARKKMDDLRKDPQVANWQHRRDQLSQLGVGGEEAKAALAAEYAASPAIQSFVKAENEFTAALNLAGSYNNVASSSANLYENDVDKMTPEAGDDRGLVTRSVASSEVDKLFGTGVVAEEKFAVSEEHGLMGVSIQCDGVGVRSQPGTVDPLGAPQTAFLDIDYSDPAIQKGMSDLEVMDYISGQIDRHPGNMFVNPENGQVKGIDNDLSFPEVDREEMLNRPGQLQGKAVAGMPKMIHKDTAEKILKVSPDELREKLRGVRPPGGGPGLSEKQIEGAVKRLKAMQAAIRHPQPGQPPEVVAEFNKQTYEQLAALQAESDAKVAKGVGNATSYLGSAMAEVEYGKKQAAKGNTMYVPCDVKGVGNAQRNPAYAEYAKNVETASQEYKARPQMIEDPARREQVIGLKQQVADVKAKIDHYDKELAKLEQGKLGARLRSLASGGTEGRKEFYAQKKAEAMQQLGSLERQLDHAARESVSEATKQGLLQDANELEQAKLAGQNQAQQNAVAPVVNQEADPGPNIIEEPEFLKQPAPTVPPGMEYLNQPAPQPPAASQAPIPQLSEDKQNIAEVKNEAQVDGPKAGGPARKPSVAEMLKRSSSMPNLSGHRTGVAANQPEGQEPKKEVAKDKSVRASGSWQAAKPKGPGPGTSLRSSIS